MLNIGEPKNVAYCEHCDRNVGGPYFYIDEARSRLAEHIEGLHSDVVIRRTQWTPRRKVIEKERRAAFNR